MFLWKNSTSSKLKISGFSIWLEEIVFMQVRICSSWFNCDISFRTLLPWSSRLCSWRGALFWYQHGQQCYCRNISWRHRTWPTFYSWLHLPKRRFEWLIILSIEWHVWYVNKREKWHISSEHVHPHYTWPFISICIHMIPKSAVDNLGKLAICGKKLSKQSQLTK